MTEAIDKQKIAQSFGKAATSYDACAPLQQAVGNELLALLETHRPESVKTVMDLGCGTGYFLPALQQMFPQAQLMGADLSLGMLDYAKQQRDVSAQWLCADAEQLPLQSNSCDVVFSSLAIQWCANTKQLFQELTRVTKPNGVIVLSTLGTRTLYELRQAWQQVDDYTHVNQFTPLADLTAALPSNLEPLSIMTHDHVMCYERLRELTRELKGIGAHNMNEGQAKGLTAPQRVKQFRTAYESFRQADGLLPATYEVHFLVLRKQDG